MGVHCSPSGTALLRVVAHGPKTRETRRRRHVLGRTVAGDDRPFALRISGCEGNPRGKTLSWNVAQPFRVPDAPLSNCLRKEAQVPLAVRFDEFGGLDVLKVVEVERPVPGPGQVLVKMVAAGINPGESSVRKGLMAAIFPTTFPSGQGSDLAGTVVEVGPEVRNFAVGDEVLGFVNTRSSQAELVVADAGNLAPRPAKVPWDAAGALFVAGTTAYAAVRAVNLRPSETVVVSGAAGGVGSIAVQLATSAGAAVIGLASEAHHRWLSNHGIIPVAYGEGVLERIREASNGRVDAFVDTFGSGYVDMAIELGVASDRIETIIDLAGAHKYGTKTDGNAAAANAAVLSESAGRIAEGSLEIPIAKAYRLADVREAYRELEQRHTLGKIVLHP
jgi:NADPH:quinone reductase-like Zn-dependent oxidoreductase